MAKRFHSQFYNIRGSTFDVEIWDSQFSGTSTEVKLADYGFNIRYANENGERWTPVIGSECEVGVYITDVTTEALITDLAASQEGRFTLRITRGVGADLQWVGRIMLDISIIEDIQFPYLFTIKATDGLSALKNIPYNNNGVAYFDNKRLTEHLTNALKKLSHVDEHYGASDVFLITSADWWEDSMTPAKAADPFYLSWLDHATFYDFKTQGEKEYLSCYEVLYNICLTFHARIYHVGGAYFVEQVPYRTATNVESRKYSKSGTYLSNETLSGSNTINQTTNGARLTLITYDFFPPARYARVVHKVNNRINYIGGTQFTNTNKSLTIYQAIESVGSQTTLRLTGNLAMTVTNDTFTDDYQQVLFVFEFKIKIGTKYLLRQVSYASYNWNYAPSEWNTSAGSRVSFVASAWPIPADNQTATYNIPVNFTSPAITEGTGTAGAEFSVDLVAAYGLNGVPGGDPLFLGDFDITWAFDDAWMEVLTFGQPYLNDSEVVYQTETAGSSVNTAFILAETVIGDAVNANTVGRLKTGVSATALTNTTVWGAGNSTPTKPILSLLSEFMYNGQAVPIRKMNGALTGGFDLKKPFAVNSIKYLFLGGTYSASRDELNGEWFQLNYGTSGVPVTPFPRRKYRYDAPDPSQDNVPSTSGGTGSPPDTESVGSPKASILRPVAYATTSESITAGAISSINVNEVLNAGDFIDGDVITIVNPINGIFEDLTVTQDSEDADTAIFTASQSLLLDYPLGSFIIKKPLSSSSNLPGGVSAWGILNWNTTLGRWTVNNLSKYVDDAAAITAGLEAGQIYIVDKGNDAIPEGVLKVIL